MRKRSERGKKTTTSTYFPKYLNFSHDPLHVILLKWQFSSFSKKVDEEKSVGGKEQIKRGVKTGNFRPFS
jgi:hypothetical protein